MASLSQLNQFRCKALSVTPPASNLTPKTSISLPCMVEFSGQSIRKPNNSPRPVFCVRAVTDDDEWGPEKKEDSAVPVAVAEEKAVEELETDRLKKALVDSFYGTDRGLKATSETRAEIVELITQLEAKNPNPAPTEALTLLNGKWILAYTSFAGLFPLLSRGTLPLVKVEEISQTIDSQNFTVQNSVQFAGPLATTSVSTNAKFEVRSPKRVQIKFDEGIISTPQLTDSLVIPENVEFLGQKIDLTPFKGILNSLQDTASNVARTISSQPPLKIPISNSNAQSWLLTTYLDEELRISRGDGGSVFVLIKEGSSLLSSLSS
ncbi:plastid-lipid-associated protein, chloroplastic-like [Prosopis cineraria]|uniref:plastid-lipid-associated protein, chloroplastic-like n=1 Tax=Prosopis cineraria TaxID=364024 RepID=UPI00240EAC9B|nr:plastid-lipid-associated protein, chloroplastic-like [Prosopis cineraria]